MANQEYFNLSRETFTMHGGGEDKPHGKIMWGVLTQEGDGTKFYSKGRHILKTGGTSLEVVGSNLKINTNSENPFNPAKIIKASKGDILLQAQSGSIILDAEQVVIKASGNKKDKTGNIFLGANVSVQVKAPDIQIKGTKTAITGTHSISLIGKNYMDTVSGFINSSCATDLYSGSLFTQLVNMQKTLSNVFGV